jgi:hypothetical protein
MSFEVNKVNCNYYLPNDFNEETNESNNKNNFALLHLSMLKDLVTSLNKSFQIIGLTETWLNDINKDNFNLPNYDYIGSNRENKRGGGVGMYVSKQLQYKTIVNRIDGLETR